MKELQAITARIQKITHRGYAAASEFLCIRDTDTYAARFKFAGCGVQRKLICNLESVKRAAVG
jgi:hypothetical protein